MNDEAMSLLDAHNYALNIGKIVIYLGRHHEPGDVGDGAVNDPIVSIIETGGFAADFVRIIAQFSPEKAAGIVRQLGLDDGASWADMFTPRNPEEQF